MDDYSNIFPLGRRDLLKWAGLAAAGSLVSPVRPLEVYAQGRSKPASTARNAIMIEMSGAISPMDCWDLKETKMTPKDLDPQRIWNDFYLSKTLFPKLIDSGLINRCSFVRSMLGRELIHLTGQYRVQTGRSINPAVAKEIPGFGSVVAYELESQRRPTDTFPTYMSTNLSRNSTGLIGAGFLPNQCTGVDLDTSFVFNVFGGGDAAARAQIERRWKVRQQLTDIANVSDATLGSNVSPYEVFYKYAYGIVTDPRWSTVFQVERRRARSLRPQPVGRRAGAGQEPDQGGRRHTVRLHLGVDRRERSVGLPRRRSTIGRERRTSTRRAWSGTRRSRRCCRICRRRRGASAARRCSTKRSSYRRESSAARRTSTPVSAATTTTRRSRRCSRAAASRASESSARPTTTAPRVSIRDGTIASSRRSTTWWRRSTRRSASTGGRSSRTRRQDAPTTTCRLRRSARTRWSRRITSICSS